MAELKGDHVLWNMNKSKLGSGQKEHTQEALKIDWSSAELY